MARTLKKIPTLAGVKRASMRNSAAASNEKVYRERISKASSSVRHVLRNILRDKVA